MSSTQNTNKHKLGDILVELWHNARHQVPQSNLRQDCGRRLCSPKILYSDLTKQVFTGPSLSFELPVALFSKPIANLLLCGWTLLTTGKLIHSIKGKSSILGLNTRYGLQPLMTALVHADIRTPSKLSAISQVRADRNISLVKYKTSSPLTNLFHPAFELISLEEDNEDTLIDLVTGARVFKWCLNLCLLKEHITTAGTPQKAFKRGHSFTRNHPCHKPEWQKMKIKRQLRIQKGNETTFLKQIVPFSWKLTRSFVHVTQVSICSLQ